MASQRWMCTYCGVKQLMPVGRRPMPGRCPKKPKTRDGKSKPHSWVKDGTVGK